MVVQGVEPVKPDYSGPNVTNVVPALLGVRPVDWLPDAVAGARAVVLLVLDGLGWDARTRHAGLLPELAALEGRVVTTVVPSTTPAALTSITTGLPPVAPRDHRVPDAARPARCSTRSAGSRTNGKRAPDPSIGAAAGGLRRAAGTRGHEEPSSAPAGSPNVHLRGAEFHGWQTTAVLVEHVRALVDGGAAVRVRLLPRGRRGRARSRPRGTLLHGRARGRRSTRGARSVTRCPTTRSLLVTADHGQVNLGPESWIGLGAARRNGRRRTRATPGSGTSTRATARRGSSSRLPSRSRARDAWVFSRDRLFDEGWLGPDPAPAGAPARRRRRARGTRRGRVRRPDLRPRDQPPLGPRVAHRRRDGGAAPRRSRPRLSHGGSGSPAWVEPFPISAGEEVALRP